MAIQTGNIYDLSEEYVLECTGGGSSCNGGWPEDALGLAIRGIPTEVTYPYLGSSSGTTTPSTPGICSTQNIVSYGQPTVYVSNKTTVEKLKSLVASGPVGVYFNAETAFGSYSNGVY